GRAFFPKLIAGPFHSGLHEAFLFAIIACVIAAAASFMRGGRYEHAEPTAGAQTARAEGVELGPAEPAGMVGEVQNGGEVNGDQPARASASSVGGEEQHAR